MEETNEQDKIQPKKERRMEKRVMREHELVRVARIKKFLHLLPWIVLALVLAALAWGTWTFYRAINRAADTVGPDLSREFESQGQDHMQEGEHATEPYNSNPPTSGPHWPDPLRDGIYDTEKPDEAIIHSMEHGRVWISYKSSIPENTKEAIKKLARSQTKIIVTVRDANDSDIAVAAWQRLDTFRVNPDGTFDEQRMLDFIRRYRDKAPEKGIPAMSGKIY